MTRAPRTFGRHDFVRSKLASLADNGGYTLSHAPLRTSPAI
jgi:hypothetical protein